jgi:hypothetical protein
MSWRWAKFTKYLEAFDGWEDTQKAGTDAFHAHEEKHRMWLDKYYKRWSDLQENPALYSIWKTNLYTPEWKAKLQASVDALHADKERHDEWKKNHQAAVDALHADKERHDCHTTRHDTIEYPLLGTLGTGSGIIITGVFFL